LLYPTMKNLSSVTYPLLNDTASVIDFSAPSSGVLLFGLSLYYF